MGKKQFFITIDTETTITDKVVDFGAVVSDRQGNIFAQCGILIHDIFGVDKLFFNKDMPGMWSAANLAKRMDNYNTMLHNGSRMLASINAINRWLEKAAGKYNPTLTAYNLAFDTSKCQNTGIDLNMFQDRFCMWGAAVGTICKTRQYRQFILDNHLFNNPTDYRNMTYSTTAESVRGFLTGQFVAEPHTALEDAIDFELPILTHIVNRRQWRDKIVAYNWKEFQVKNYFKAV